MGYHILLLLQHPLLQSNFQMYMWDKYEARGELLIAPKRGLLRESLKGRDLLTFCDLVPSDFFFSPSISVGNLGVKSFS